MLLLLSDLVGLVCCFTPYSTARVISRAVMVMLDINPAPTHLPKQEFFYIPHHIDMGRINLCTKKEERKKEIDWPLIKVRLLTLGSEMA